MAKRAIFVTVLVVIIASIFGLAKSPNNIRSLRNYVISENNPKTEIEFFFSGLASDFQDGDIARILEHFSKNYKEASTRSDLNSLKSVLNASITDGKIYIPFSKLIGFRIKEISIDSNWADVKIDFSFKGPSNPKKEQDYQEELKLTKNSDWKIFQSQSLSATLNNLRQMSLELDNREVKSFYKLLDRSGFPSIYETDSMFIPKLLFDHDGTQYDVRRMCLIAAHAIWGHDGFATPMGISAYIHHITPCFRDWLYVTDYDAHRFLFTDDYPNDITKKFVAAYGSYGHDNTHFKHPVGIDNWGENVLIADASNDRIMEYHTDQISTSHNLTFVNAYTGYKEPRDVAVWEQHFFAVADYGSNRVRVQSGWLGSTGSGYGQFNGPTSLAFGCNPQNGWENGVLYVADQGNGRLVKIDYDSATGYNGIYHYYTGFNALELLPSVDVDGRGSVYVVSHYNSKISKFSANLDLIACWGRQGRCDFRINRPQSLSIAHGFEYPYGGSLTPLILGEAFMTEGWEDSTGIRRFEFGIDIMDFDLVYYRPLYYPNLRDYLSFKFWLSDYADVTELIYYQGVLVDSIDCGYNLAPGYQYDKWNIADTSKYGMYTVKLRAKTTYNNNRICQRDQSVERTVNYLRPRIIQGPIFTSDDSTRYYNQCIARNKLYTVYVQAVDSNGTVESYDWETNAGLLYPDTKEDSKSVSTLTTEEPRVIFSLPAAKSSKNQSPKDELLYFKVKAIDNDGIESEVASFLPQPMDTCQGHKTYICGDANKDGSANVTDAVYIINYVMAGGPPPHPFIAGDCNCDSSVNISDAIWIINYIFAGGRHPCDTAGDGQPEC